MEISAHEIEFKDQRALSTELLFMIACDRVDGCELMNVRLLNLEALPRFKKTAATLLRAMKREGHIRLFVFEDELFITEKTECVYLLNKYPELASRECSECGIYIKL